jgi:hypothetical protein
LIEGGWHPYGYATSPLTACISRTRPTGAGRSVIAGPAPPRWGCPCGSRARSHQQAAACTQGGATPVSRRTDQHHHVRIGWGGAEPPASTYSGLHWGRGPRGFCRGGRHILPPPPFRSLTVLRDPQIKSGLGLRRDSATLKLLQRSLTIETGAVLHMGVWPREIESGSGPCGVSKRLAKSRVQVCGAETGIKS